MVNDDYRVGVPFREIPVIWPACVNSWEDEEPTVETPVLHIVPAQDWTPFGLDAQRLAPRQQFMAMKAPPDRWARGVIDLEAARR